MVLSISLDKYCPEQPALRFGKNDAQPATGSPRRFTFRWIASFSMKGSINTGSDVLNDACGAADNDHAVPF
jgi:hypothetical protein